jgi:glucose-6-phosphate isomerase
VRLALTGYDAESKACFSRFADEDVLTRLRAATPNDPLVPLGTEYDAEGRPCRNLYGVFDLAWQAVAHAAWASQVEQEVDAIRRRIRDAHGRPLRFLIWAGMGGSIEDKSMYAAVGLLRRGVRFYALDSTDPAKPRAILDDLTRRSGGSLRDALRSTLVVGMALGRTSYEPVLNLEKLTRLYERARLDPAPHFLYLTIDGSLLDAFARPRGYRRVPLQLDGRETTAGRHSGPLTRGSLYPLALAGVDLRAWLAGARLADTQVMAAWKLAAFVHAHGVRGRDKVTLVLPRAWRGAGVWTKQDFEESLGKSEALGIKIVIGESAAESLRAAAAADRLFLVVRRGGTPDHPSIDALRRAAAAVAVVDVPLEEPLSRYMQFVHYVVFGLGYLRRMNFVTQPAVELYKSIANALHQEAGRAGGPMQTEAWRAMTTSPRRMEWRRRVRVYFDGIESELPAHDAAAAYAAVVRELVTARRVEYGEMTFYGDTRFDPSGRALRAILERAGSRVFRRALRLPVDVYEGPAVNHSYHEMIIGHGRCVSTVLVSAMHRPITPIGYAADYHLCQFLATKLALTERRRPVIAIVLKDLTAATREATDAFFVAVARHLRGATR